MSKSPVEKLCGISSLSFRDMYNSSKLSVLAFSIRYFIKIDEMYTALRAFIKDKDGTSDAETHSCKHQLR